MVIHDTIPFVCCCIRALSPSAQCPSSTCSPLLSTSTLVYASKLFKSACDRSLREILCSRHAWKHHLRHSRCGLLLAAAWILGLAVGCAPPILLRHTQEKFRDKCEFMIVVDFRFLVTFVLKCALKMKYTQVYIIFYGTIITPTVIILLCYLSIYRKIKGDSARLRRNLSVVEMERRCTFTHVMYFQFMYYFRTKQRHTIIRSLFTVVLTFLSCWCPLYTINTIIYYLPDSIDWRIILSAVCLSHCSAALNPVIYAFGLPAFR